jgi:mono/diheme cytochrome c family protein
MANIMKFQPALVFLFATVMMLGSCSSRKSLPIAGPVSLDDKQHSGEVLFMKHCQSCHPQGEAGLGPPIHWAPSFAKRIQIRHGFGAMPAFDKDAISRNEMDALIDYLKAMKKNG